MTLITIPSGWDRAVVCDALRGWSLRMRTATIRDTVPAFRGPDGASVSCPLDSTPVSVTIARPSTLDAAWWAGAARVLGRALRDRFDEQIVTAISAIAPVPATVTGGDSFTYDKLLKALTEIVNYRSAGATWAGAVGPRQWAQAACMPPIPGINPVIASAGGLPSDHVHWDSLPILPVAAGVRSCLIWSDASVGHAVDAAGPTLSVTDGSDAIAEAVWGSGAVVLDAQAMRLIPCLET